jgi:hypothetical protein
MIFDDAADRVSVLRGDGRISSHAASGGSDDEWHPLHAELLIA